MFIINIIKRIYYFIINIFKKENNNKCNIIETARVEKPDGSIVAYFEIK